MAIQTGGQSHRMLENIGCIVSAFCNSALNDTNESGFHPSPFASGFA